MVICVGSQKGGTGKSTLAANLAAARAGQGAAVLLIDADPQGTTAEFSRSRNDQPQVAELACVQVQGISVAPEVKKLRPRYDDLVVDVGGRYTEALAGALRVADLVVVPFLPSVIEGWALEDMEKIVAKARGENPKLRACCVLNAAYSVLDNKENREAREFAASMEGMELLETVIVNRVIYRQAFGLGLAVTEMPKGNPKACAEIEALFTEVWK